ncbi:hypothetical protein KEM56_004112 [Ascosphaera pollenicola]|nr:hypothetical protein KEM56_004112 [Ascosphaera pollenicola]
MKLLRRVLLISLIALFQLATANWVGSKAQDQEVDLKRWLADHDIPHPPHSNREELEQLVRDNWQHKISAPLSHAKGRVSDAIGDAIGDAKQWVFDTWDESMIKRFLDSHGVTTPKPSNRNIILQTAKDNYDTIAQKAGETARYPGDWLYAQWSDSQLKEYLDKHGYPVPQHTKRDRLIAAVRRAGFLASKKYEQKYYDASSAVVSAKESISDAALQKWSDADFRKFFEQHGIRVPSGYSREEIMGLVHKYKHLFTEQARASVSKIHGAFADQTEKASQATEAAKDEADKRFEDIIKMWSDMRLKEYLAARKVSVEAGASRDELRKKVYEYRNKAASKYGSWIFDTWNEQHLRDYLASTQQKVSESAGQTRDELVRQAQAAYDKASRTSGSEFAAATNYIASVAKSAVDVTLHGWSRTDLEDYLKSFGIIMAPSYGIEDLRKEAQKHAQYYRYGLQSPGWTWDEMWSGTEGAMGWIWSIVKRAAYAGRQQGKQDSRSVKEKLEATVRRVADEL